ncbi:hypothetical protein ABPG74_000459 [Tetrahymena malaccensis]
MAASCQFGQQIMKDIVYSEDEQSALQDRIRNRCLHDPTKIERLRQYCSTLKLDKSLSKNLQEYIDESYLYEHLNNALILLNQSFENSEGDEKSLIYFQLVVVILKSICANDLYILTYDMCKDCDILIKKFSPASKNTKFYDKLMLSYHYYRGFSQTNFDEKHKFQDYIICKQYFFQLLYKKYPELDLNEIKEIEKDLQENVRYKLIKEQALSIIACQPYTSVSSNSIKKNIKDQSQKKQIKETEQSFFENFFLCYLFFRQENGRFEGDVKTNLLEQCLLINKKNPKFDLGVQQIYKCFSFHSNWKESQKTCLRIVRQQMQNEKLINSKNSKHKTIYEKYIDLTEEERKQICQNNSNSLHKYLKQLAEIYIYNQNPIEFLNIWRCLSILSPENYYINYMFYLEQQLFFTKTKFYNSKETDQYDKLVEDLQKDLENQSQEKKLFWHLSFNQIQKRISEENLEYLPLIINKDSPIVSIRKIMNNIYFQIQQSYEKKENIFNKIFDLDYDIFKKQSKEYKDQQQQKDQKTNTVFTKIKIKDKVVFLKSYDFSEQNEQESNYFFVQEVAISIYLREKQHQKYLPFQKNIGYHSFNRYIYHFVQDKTIFLILEYYPIIQKQILSEEHFRSPFKHDHIQESEQMTRSKASSISSIKSYQTDGLLNVIGQNRRVSQEFNVSGLNFTSSDEQRQRNSSVASELSSISNSSSKNENWISTSLSSSIQFSSERSSYIPKVKQNSQNRKQFTKKDLFICMLRIEQICEILKDNNMIHKDIKLDNIAWRETDEPILIDFGITELYQVFSYYMFSTGTFSYKSYQQEKSLPINENTDLTAFIIVIYELARGESIDFKQCENGQKASYISKNIHKELKDMFSRDFMNLIQTVVDCQLDTIKSRAKYFMWQKFEIFMNLLYDCQKLNDKEHEILHYGDFYKKVKKALKRTIQKKKHKLDIKFDLNLLINLKNDPTFQMLISLQSHDILKHYESLLYIIINEEKMEEFKKKTSNLPTQGISASFQSSESQNYSSQNEQLKLGIETIYRECLINQNDISFESFQQNIINIFNSRHKIFKLNEKKYKFNFDVLEKLFLDQQEKQKSVSIDHYLLNKIYIKLIKQHYQQLVFEELAHHIEETEKSIINFQAKTSKKIIKAYNRTDEIRDIIQFKLQKQQASLILPTNLQSTQSQSQEQLLQQTIQQTNQINSLSVSSISSNQVSSPSNQSAYLILTQQHLNYVISQDASTYKSIFSQNTNRLSQSQISNINNLTPGNSFPNSQTNTNQNYIGIIQTQILVNQPSQNNQIDVNSALASSTHSNIQNLITNTNQSSDLDIEIPLTSSSQSRSINQAISDRSYGQIIHSNNAQMSNNAQQEGMQNLNQTNQQQFLGNQQISQNQTSSFNSALVSQIQNSVTNQSNDSSVSSLGIDISSIDKSQNSSVNNQSNQQQQLQQNQSDSSNNNSKYTFILNNSNSSQKNLNNSSLSLRNNSNHHNMNLILQQNRAYDMLLVEQEQDDIKNIQSNYSQNNSYEEVVYDFSIRNDQIIEKERTLKHASIKFSRNLQKENNKNNKNSSQQMSIK